MKSWAQPFSVALNHVSCRFQDQELHLWILKLFLFPIPSIQIRGWPWIMVLGTPQMNRGLIRPCPTSASRTPASERTNPYTGFSASALLTFGAGQFFVVGICPVHCRMLSSVTVPSTPQLWQLKMTLDIASNPYRVNSSRLRTIELKNQESKLYAFYMGWLAGWL